MNEIVFKTLKEKDYIVKNFIFKLAKDMNLNIDDVILIIYLMNQDEPILNLEAIKKNMYLSEENILESYSKLVGLNLIAVDMVKDENGIIKEVINLDNIVKQATTERIESTNNQNRQNVFETFEKEFGRTLSPMEFEIINNWLDGGTSEEIIIEALKESIYNGAKSLRYVSKIILAWQEKGFKSKKDIQNHIENNHEEKPQEKLFEYNWLDEE